MTELHLTDLIVHPTPGTLVKPICQCGWQGDWTPSTNDANDAAITHIQEARYARPH